MIADILYSLLLANLAAGAAILVVMMIRGPMRRMIGARLAYWLWAAPVAAGLAGLLPSPVVSFAPVLHDVLPQLDPAGSTTAIAGAALPPAEPLSARPAAITASPQAAGIDIALLLFAAWIAGAILFLAVIVFRQQRAMTAFGKLEANEDDDALQAENARVGPAVIGLFLPRVVMPADFYERYSQHERGLILAHERAHLAAGHTRINAGMALATCICWFNPLVHIAARLSRVDQELACDAAVVERFPGQRRAYAEALLKTQIGHALPLGCTWPSKSSSLLMQRVELLARQAPGRGRRIAGAAIIATAALAAGCAGWATQPPESKPAPVAAVAPATTAQAAPPGEPGAPAPIVVTEADLANVFASYPGPPGQPEIKVPLDIRMMMARRQKAEGRMRFSPVTQKAETRQLDPLSEDQLRAISVAIATPLPTGSRRDQWELAWYSGRLISDGAYLRESQIPEGKAVEAYLVYEPTSGPHESWSATFFSEFSPAIDHGNMRDSPIPMLYEMRVDAKADGAMTFAILTSMGSRKVLATGIKLQSDGFAKFEVPGGHVIGIFATLRDQMAIEKDHVKRLLAARARGQQALDDERIAINNTPPPGMDPSLGPPPQVLEQMRRTVRNDSAIRALGAKP